MSHTPGPWNFDAQNVGHTEHCGYAIYDRDFETGRELCYVLCSNSKADELGFDAVDANARLIAAAPDLLEAAKAVLADLEAHIEAGAVIGRVPVFNGIADLHIAIRKAEGKQ